MWKKYIKPLLAIIVIAFTVTFFIVYIVNNPEVIDHIKQIKFEDIIILIILYLIAMIALALVNTSTLRLCSIKAVPREILLLTAYSAVINFFGPLQSGPAARALYLKKKYDLNLKKYAKATIIYYFFWALFSGILLMSGIFKWYTIPILAGIAIIILILTKQKFILSITNQLDFKNWYLLALATLLQITIISIIYFFELHIVSPNIKYSQAIIYTGAANFSLFVSITPGALGFREAFLLFSRRLDHIGSSIIVAANIIDRTIYIILLLLLALVIIATHASNKLGLTKEVKA